MVSITANPLSAVQPRENFLEESISVALARINTKLSNPDGLVEGLVELGEVVLEVVGVGPGIVVSDNEVDLAVRALCHELLEVVDALVGLVAIGYCGRADLKSLASERLDVLLVRFHSVVNRHVGTSATNGKLAARQKNMECAMRDLPGLIRLVEAEYVFDVVLALCVLDVLFPTLSAPLLVGMKKRNEFESSDWFAVDDCLPVVHP